MKNATAMELGSLYRYKNDMPYTFSQQVRSLYTAEYTLALSDAVISYSKLIDRIFTYAYRNVVQIFQVISIHSEYRAKMIK